MITDPALAVSTILDLVATRGHDRAPRVLIDGFSGSGKTTLAHLLHVRWPEADLIHMDALCPGWDGLRAGADLLVSDLLRSPAPRWRQWDWDTDRWAEVNVVDPRTPLIIEGSGALSRAARAEADVGVWLAEEPETVRRHRAIVTRGDGDMYAPHWDRWAAQERAFFAQERPDRIADLVISLDRVPAVATTHQEHP